MNPPSIEPEIPTTRSGRSRPGWVAWGSVAMAVLAALALAATVLVAQRAIGKASLLFVRGEGEALIAALRADLPYGAAPLEERLALHLKQHEAAGLRYIGVLGHDGRDVLAQAGEAKMAGRGSEPGALAVSGRRVRLTSTMPPRAPDNGRRPGEPAPSGAPRAPDDRPDRRDGPPDDFPPRDDPFRFAPPPRRPPPPPDDPFRDGPPRGGPFGDGPFGDRPFGDGPPLNDRGPGRGPGGPSSLPLLVIELEPPVFEELRADVSRTVVVGAVAGLVLVVFAIAWSRAVLRLAAIERQAEGERRLAALGRMSSVMAHELRNPIASLKGHAQLLSETLEEDARAHAKAERVVGEAVRLERLTESLLAFVRDAPVDLRPVSPADLIASALEHEDATRVKLDLARAPATVSVDAPRVASALRNLVQNALQATSGDGVVELTAEAEPGAGREGDAVVFVVRDRGPGLPKGREAQIFEPFVTTRARGTGLGLPLARRIAEQHGGTLTGESHPEGGAVFRLRIPAAARPG